MEEILTGCRSMGEFVGLSFAGMVVSVAICRTIDTKLSMRARRRARHGVGSGKSRAFTASPSEGQTMGVVPEWGRSGRPDFLCAEGFPLGTWDMATGWAAVRRDLLLVESANAECRQVSCG